jgi:hypothetical protein
MCLNNNKAPKQATRLYVQNSADQFTEGTEFEYIVIAIQSLVPTFSLVACVKESLNNTSLATKQFKSIENRFLPTCQNAVDEVAKNTTEPSGQ